MYDEFKPLNTVVIAVSQEDTDLKSHAKFLNHFGEAGPAFPIVADLNRKMTTRYDRTTTYLIDKHGVVREIFPALIHARPNWHAVLNRIKELEAPDESKPAAQPQAGGG